MHKKVFIFAIIILFIGASVVSGFSIDSNNNYKPTSRGWLYVGGSGPGNYSTIQSAITAASTGDTIFVYSGIYYEQVNIGKSISLIGENKISTIIDASGTGQAVEILSDTDDVSIEGFTCRNGAIGIYLNNYCDEITINDNIIENNLEDGIMINEFSSYHEISDNIIMNNGDDGISIRNSLNNIISNNDITGNDAKGIYVYFNSDYNDIFGNNIVNNSGYGMHISSVDYNNVISNTVTENTGYGLYISYTNYNDVSGNTITNNNGQGLYFGDSYYSNISGNTFTSNSGYGVHLRYSLNNNILSNTISDNLNYGIYFAGNCDNNVVSDNVIEGHSDFGIFNYYYSDNNVFTENTITDNGCGIKIYDTCKNNLVSTNTITNNALGLELTQSSTGNLVYNNLFNNENNSFDGCLNNLWNITKTPGANIMGGPYLGGNVFNDYTGEDTDGDGLGDTPYDIPGAGGSSDFHPLTPWDNLPPEITNVDVDPPIQNHDEYVKISCSVTDNFIVEQVLVIITYPDTSIHNFTMEPSYYLNQTYSEIGKYYFAIWAVDNNGNVNTSAQYSFEIINLNPDDPARPSGKTSGKINVEYTYSTSTTEPEGDDVYYWFDWGDGTNSDWVGPFVSGDPASADHAWTEKGTYEIRVKAKDTLGAESAWSEPLSVKMPRTCVLFSTHPILLWLLEKLPIFRHLLGL